MAGPRTLSVLIFALALIFLCQQSEAQRRQNFGFPDDNRRPGGGNRFPGNNRPGGSGGAQGSGAEFWPGTGGSNGNRPGGGQQGGGQQGGGQGGPSSGTGQDGEFWPGAGGSTTTTRRPSGGGNSGCSCPSTPEYNPVCGTNGVSYGNPGKLNCAKACGANVSILHYGNCTPADPNAPTASSTTTPSTTTTRRRRN